MKALLIFAILPLASFCYEDFDLRDSDCVKNGKYYSPDSLDDILQTVKDIDSWPECCKLCQADSRCGSWNWNWNTKADGRQLNTCETLQGNADLSYIYDDEGGSDSAVFGTKDCPCSAAPVPTVPPTKAPTDPPTKAPTEPPTKAPTEPPTKAPTDPPTKAPTDPPTKAPTEPPTKAPTEPPTKAPTEPPTKAPTEPPTKVPTEVPTISTTIKEEKKCKDKRPRKRCKTLKKKSKGMCGKKHMKIKCRKTCKVCKKSK